MDEIRLTDAERDNASMRLRAAFAEGRLDEAELADRLDAVYRAKTATELSPVYAGLPVPAEPKPPAAKAPSALADRLASPVVKSALFICAMVTVIYLLTNPGGYFWPVWVYFGMAVSTGPVLLGLGPKRR